MKTKSNPTVKQAALQAFRSLTDIFYGHELHKIVKIITRRKGIYISSSLRKLRQLRKEGRVNYRLIGSKDNSLYIKTEITPDLDCGIYKEKS
jgi:hypothetical protein